MSTVLLVVHLMIALALIGMVLVQRSEGGGLGMGGGGGGSFMTGRGTANLLTRTTVWLAGAFFATSLGLTLLSQPTNKPGSLFDPPAATTPAPASAPATPGAPVTPAEPGAPSAPTAPAAGGPATPAEPAAPPAAARGGILDKLQQSPGGAPPRLPQSK